MANTSFFQPLAQRDHPRGSPRAAARMPRAMISFIDRLAAWVERGRERRMLAGLDDRMLADIGISRAEAASEWAKPGWQR